MRGVVWILVLFGLPILLLVLATGQDPAPQPPGPCADEESALKQLNPRAEEYANATGAPAGGQAQVRGGVVPIVEAPAPKVDEPVYCALPDELKARSPEQVETVVLIDYGERVVGRYTSGGAAVQVFARLTIVDRQSNIQYNPGIEFSGPEPPFSVEGAGKQRIVGDPPTGKIAKYLRTQSALTRN